MSAGDDPICSFLCEMKWTMWLSFLKRTIKRTKKGRSPFRDKNNLPTLSPRDSNQQIQITQTRAPDVEPRLNVACRSFGKFWSCTKKSILHQKKPKNMLGRPCDFSRSKHTFVLYKNMNWWNGKPKKKKKTTQRISLYKHWAKKKLANVLDFCWSQSAHMREGCPQEFLWIA